MAGLHWRKPFLAAVLTIALTPALAQEPAGIDCVANSDDRELASDLVDESLAGNDLATMAEGLQQRLAVQERICMESSGVPYSISGGYFTANIGYMMAEEKRRRLIAAGLDMTATETLLTLRREDSALDVSDYIDARPDEFARPMETLSDQNGIGADTLMILVGGYLGMRLLQDQGRQEMAER